MDRNSFISIPDTVIDDMYTANPFAAPGAIVDAGDFQYRVYSANPYSEVEITVYRFLGEIVARVVLGRENSEDEPTARIARSRGITNEEAIAAAPVEFRKNVRALAAKVLP